jgi:hypothetical protein
VFQFSPRRVRRTDTAGASSEGKLTAAALDAFRDAGVTWAGTGYGKPLVDAAAEALAVGLDTPTLRVLAGAPARFADEEASEYAPDAFEELGLDIPEKLSEEAYLELARLKAREFLQQDGSARQLAVELYRLYVNSDYRPELGDFSGLDDWYGLLDEGLVQGDPADVDSAVRESAQRLVQGLPSQGLGLGGALWAHPPSPPEKQSLLRRIRQRVWKSEPL